MKLSDSRAQKQAEAEVLSHLEKLLQCRLEHDQKIRHAAGTACPNVDGIDRAAKVICEIYAHIGKTSPSRDKKIVSDAMKLLLIDKLLGGGYRKIIVLVDDEFARKFKPGSDSWQALALAEYGVEVQVVPVSELTRRGLLEAQMRQGLGNTKKSA